MNPEMSFEALAGLSKEERAKAEARSNAARKRPDLYLEFTELVEPYGIPPWMVFAHVRSPKIIRARWEALIHVREKYGWSHPEASHFFGFASHAPSLDAWRRLSKTRVLVWGLPFEANVSLEVCGEDHDWCLAITRAVDSKGTLLEAVSAPTLLEAKRALRQALAKVE